MMNRFMYAKKMKKTHDSVAFLNEMEKNRLELVLFHFILYVCTLICQLTTN